MPAIYRTELGVPICTSCLEQDVTADEDPEGRCYGCRSGAPMEFYDYEPTIN